MNVFVNGYVTLLCEEVAPEANGLGVVAGRGGAGPVALVSWLRLTCGVAGAELALDAAGDALEPKQE